MKNVMIISASPRKNVNSDILCTNFMNGALAAGHSVEKIDLRDKNIGYCIGCYACTKLGKCFQNDDMNELAKKLENADVIVLATPVYFYSMDAQLKTFIDRTVQNYTKIRADIYIMATAWDPNAASFSAFLGVTPSGAVKVVDLMICFLFISYPKDTLIRKLFPLLVIVAIKFNLLY